MDWSSLLSQLDPLTALIIGGLGWWGMRERERANTQTDKRFEDLKATEEALRESSLALAALTEAVKRGVGNG